MHACTPCQEAAQLQRVVLRRAIDRSIDTRETPPLLRDTRARPRMHARTHARNGKRKSERATNARSHLNQTCGRKRLLYPSACPVSSRQKGGPSTLQSPLLVPDPPQMTYNLQSPMALFVSLSLYAPLYTPVAVLRVC